MEDMRNEAEAKGMDTLAKLMQKLFATGRLKDAERAANDSAYREKLLKEFSLA